MSCTPTQKESIKSFLKRICNVHDALSYILPCRRHCGSRRGHLGADHTTHTVCRDQSMRRCVSDPTGRHRCTPAGRPCAGSAADTTPCDSKHQCRVGVGVEFNAPPSTVLVISEVVFTANHLTGTDKQKPPYRKTYKLNTTHIKQTKQNTAKQNYPGSVATYDTRPGNEVGLFCKAPDHTIQQARKVH